MKDTKCLQLSITRGNNTCSVNKGINKWRGSGQVSPKCATLAHGWFWAENHQEPTDSREKFTLSLTT